ARLFERLADRWPGYEHSHRALYRAGLGYAAAGDEDDAIRAWTRLTGSYPESEYARDARLNIARTQEAGNRPEAAARSYREFAAAYPEDADAGSALLLAADLFARAGDSVASESVKTSYLEAFPDDVETRAAILEERARRELDALADGEAVTPLLVATSGSNLARYVELTNERPELAATAILARVRFLRGEEERVRYERSPITLPLAPSIAQKKSLLENVLQEYRNAAAYEVAPWNRAAAVRIGECLVAFGDALMASERPADLTEDDLYAYEDVLEEQSWEFFDRGEEAWTRLVRQVGSEASADVDDEWVAEARARLWPRVASRFLHRPEVKYPLVAADHRQPDEAP
ncbi:MAG TPA: tetratricopeptide repeat protein, partial [bacterium]|nr:tetratricopeptide repeat protein [bacterium]